MGALVSEISINPRHIDLENISVGKHHYINDVIQNNSLSKELGKIV